MGKYLGNASGIMLSMPRQRAPRESLDSAQVAAFVAAPKSVVATTVEWKAPGGAVDALRWRSVLETGSIAVGELSLYSNASIARNWNFHLALRGHSVFGWHFSPGSRHKNWKSCDADFLLNGRVKSPHEQVWIDGPGFKCAHALTGLDELTHEEILGRFCNRASIEFTATYHPPQSGEEQLTLFGEAAL